ncbi:hypothetical protein KAU04_09100, partial [bacterium]|nr:hypothetical protein [bacterium]
MSRNWKAVWPGRGSRRINRRARSQRTVSAHFGRTWWGVVLQIGKWMILDSGYWILDSGKKMYLLGKHLCFASIEDPASRIGFFLS